MSNVWAAVSAISSAVAAVVVIIAAIYAHRQLAEARNSRHMSLLISFQEKYHSIPARKFRRKLLSGELGAPDDFEADRLGAADFHELWQMLDQLEMLGVLVDRGLVDFDLIVSTFHRSPPMVWLAVRPYVFRRRREASPLECRYLEMLVDRYRQTPVLNDEFWTRLDRL
jgi:hypothetical protein